MISLREFELLFYGIVLNEVIAVIKHCLLKYAI